ncbi:alpha/beta fold hydrolase [Hahella ganghwensis]|uniref:alpha/beta fold hydrolase n=1 Tax=Hahella ganghwensis TaxID=286420 RepID=UPI0004776EA4|nr:alpha/beta hydrolase [Hahella ganghwensis]
MTRSVLLCSFIALILLTTGCSSMKPAMKASPTLANALGMADIPLKDLKKKYTDQNSRFIEVNDLEIHYRDVGEGPVIVLMHGIMSSLQTWDGWSEELSKNFRVISLDMPGFGLTGGPEDIDDFNEDYIFNTFAKFIDNIELERFSMAGNSFGGYIAARYAVQYPERVEKLILLDPSGYPQERPWIFKLATAPVISTLSKMVQPPFLITKNVMDIYGDRSRLSQDNLYRYVHMAQRAGAKSIYVKTMEMQSEASTTERPLPFASIDAPTLLMWGEDDRWIPIELAERWKADVRNLEFISYPGVGHMPMEEIPYQTVQDAIVFLADVQQAPTQSSPSIDELESILQGEDFSSDFAPMEGL